MFLLLRKQNVVADQNSTVHDQKKSAEKPIVSNVHEGECPIEQQTGEAELSTCSKDHNRPITLPITKSVFWLGPSMLEYQAKQ